MQKLGNYIKCRPRNWMLKVRKWGLYTPISISHWLRTTPEDINSFHTCLPLYFQSARHRGCVTFSRDADAGKWKFVRERLVIRPNVNGRAPTASATKGLEHGVHQIFVRHGVYLGKIWNPSSIQFGRSVMSNSLQSHGLLHARPPCPSSTPGVDSNSCPLIQ